MHSNPAATLYVLLASFKPGFVGQVYRLVSTPVIPEIVYHITIDTRIRTHVAHVPISFALLDKNHLSVQREIEDFLLFGSPLLSRPSSDTRKL